MDRQSTRRKILASVRKMAEAFPVTGYCEARERFGLLGIIKRLCNNVQPTAKQCWEFVGLTRQHLVDEFEFAQVDIAEVKS
jgi:hypothetical protein